MVSSHALLILQPSAQSSMAALRQILPSSLYTTGLPMLPSATMAPAPEPSRRPISIPAPSEKIELYSPAYYRACVIGGILSCGLTHTAVRPCPSCLWLPPMSYRSSWPA